MKERKVLYGFIFALIALTAVSCSGPVMDEVAGLIKEGKEITTGTGDSAEPIVPAAKGSLTIVWGNPNKSRAFVQENDLSTFSYTLTLKGPNGHTETPELSPTAMQVQLTLPAGIWTITLKGFSTEGGNMSELRVMGLDQIELHPGPNETKIIPIHTAKEIDITDGWDSLAQQGVFDTYSEYSNNDEANYNQLLDPGITWPRSEILLLKGSGNMEDIREKTDEETDTIEIKRRIILVAEEDVTIKREANKDAYTPFFEIVSGGILTLGKPGMTGSIVFDNVYEEAANNASVSPSSDPLFIVTDGELILNDGVTITHGNAINGGGVYVASDGKLTVNGGKITANTATSKGGGVYVAVGGKYVKNNDDDVSGNFFQNGTNNPSGEATDYTSDPGANVYEQPALAIDNLYIGHLMEAEADSGITLESSIDNIAGTITFSDKNTMHLAATQGVSANRTIEKLSTAGAEEVRRAGTFTPDGSTVPVDCQWSYLYQDTTKIGIIYYYTQTVETQVYEFTGFKFSTLARDFIGRTFTNVNDYYDIDNSDYSPTGSGDTKYNGTGGLGFVLDGDTKPTN